MCDSQFSSITQLCPPLCDTMDCRTPGFPVYHQLPLSYSKWCPLSRWCHPTIWSSVVPFSSRFQFSSIKVLSSESVLRIRWSKYWSFSFSIRPSNEYSGLISFRIKWLDLLTVRGTLKSLLQHHSSKASILWKSAFFMVQLLYPYMTTIALSCYSLENLSLFQLFPLLFAMKWWDQMPWSQFFECWVLSQLFPSPLSPSSWSS